MKILGKGKEDHSAKKFGVVSDGQLQKIGYHPGQKKIHYIYNIIVVEGDSISGRPTIRRPILYI